MTATARFTLAGSGLVLLVIAAVVGVVLVSEDRSNTDGEEVEPGPVGADSPGDMTGDLGSDGIDLGSLEWLISHCEQPRGTADLDGDGVSDRIGIAVTEARSRVVGCLSTGGIVATESEAAEAFVAADLNGDDRDEIAVGPTLMRSGHPAVLSVVDGDLVPVVIARDGEPLRLSEGHDVDRESGEVVGSWAWGCRDTANRGRLLVLVRAEGHAWHSQVMSLRDGEAEIIEANRGDAPDGNPPAHLLEPCD